MIPEALSGKKMSAQHGANQPVVIPVAGLGAGSLLLAAYGAAGNTGY